MDAQRELWEKIAKEGKGREGKGKGDGIHCQFQSQQIPSLVRVPYVDEAVMEVQNRSRARAREGKLNQSSRYLGGKEKRNKGR